MKVLTCPKCREETLERKEPLVYERSGATGKGRKARKVPALLPARCSRCHGLWLTRDDIARLRSGEATLDVEAVEAPPADPPAPLSAGPSAPLRAGLEIDRRGGLCPDCGRILVRTFLGEDPADEDAEEAGFFLDRCAHCGGIWFDAGELSELTGDREIEDLSQLWDPEWRRGRLEEHNRRIYRARLEERLGPELFQAVETLVERVRDEPEKRAAVLAHLHEELGYEPP